ncbi:glycosyltransferase [Methylocystis sp. H62]|uniref:glycosyltransferase n=1 Tax=Methylocystis sp. H62 TaxID=2785789 RepID=UPI0018C26AC5|nr:glycosyltransferase [Methylocystis sp. H62]MBG0792635.1 glycosyltransferase [Methylocystis sp. H62]
MKISIAMATFNGANYVRHQLESFTRQTRLPDELIICDDCSTDETTTIISKFAKAAPFNVTLIKNEANLGYNKNFPKAISECSGDLIFISDQDDIWLPEKISYMETVAASRSSNQLLWMHDGRLVDEHLKWGGSTKLGQVSRGYGNVTGVVTGALTLIHHDLLHYISPFPEGIEYDGWIHSVAHRLGARCIIDEELQLIRRHSSNATEWIASSTARINSLDVIWSAFKTPRAHSYEDRITINKALQRQFDEKLSNGCLSLRHDEIFNILKYISDEASALNSRTRLVAAGPIERRFLAVRMLAEGKYNFFNGFSSFLRDFTR